MKALTHQMLTEQLERYAYENMRSEGEVRKGDYTYVLQWSKSGEFEQLCIQEKGHPTSKVCGYSYQ